MFKSLFTTFMSIKPTTKTDFSCRNNDKRWFKKVRLREYSTNNNLVQKKSVMVWTDWSISWNADSLVKLGWERWLASIIIVRFYRNTLYITTYF